MSFSSAHPAVDLCLRALERLRAGEPAAMEAWVGEHLFGHVLPFWEQRAIDARGGILTCIKDDGTVSSGDKWLWSQWRAVWVFSRIHRSLDASDKWLRLARHVADFCICHAWDARRRQWALLVAQDGKVLRGHDSTYVDAFAIQALAQLHFASGECEYLRLARETADAALVELSGRRDIIPHFPYPIPSGAKPHAIPMIWSIVLAELGEAVGEPRYLRAARAFADEIFNEFYRPNRRAVLEFLRLDGGELPPPLGTAIVPGHAIESMWFQLHIAHLVGGEHRTDLARDLILRHLELGWDAVHGGLLLAVDADGARDVGWKFADTKLWWPHTEALYAVLLGWKQNRSACFLDWYERLWRFCLEHFVDWQHGEWRQKLTRSLLTLDGTIALPVKDPFHLPRSLVLQIELLRDAGASPPLNGAANVTSIASRFSPVRPASPPT